MRKGLTMMELVVGTTIIGVLASVGIPSYRLHIERVRASEGVAILTSLFAAQERYKLDNGVYTAVLTDLDVTIPASASFANLTVTTSAGELARIRRTDGSVSDYYEIWIKDDGTIDCIDEGAFAVQCSDLGRIVTGVIH